MIPASSSATYEVPVNGSLLAAALPFQIFALAFSGFMILYLIWSGVARKNMPLPLLTFASLMCSSSLPLLDIFAGWQYLSPMTSALFFGHLVFSPLTFLLVLQITSSRPPSFPAWLILGVPLGTYGRHLLGLPTRFTSVDQQLFDWVGVALLLLLLASTLVLLKRVPFAVGPFRPSRFWLAIQLMVINLSLLAIDLADLAAILPHSAAYLTAAVLRFSFLYRLA
jgi:hypothetical protein